MKKIKQGIRRVSIGTLGTPNNGKPIITEEDLDYIAQHTSVSREDVSSRFDAFIKHHPDGKINRKEFRSMITTCYPDMTNCKKLEKHIFRMYDTDGDGTIDFREFMVLLYIMSSGTPEENLGQIFRIFDKNNDGSITRDEMQRIVKDLYDLFNTDKRKLSKAERRRSSVAMANTAFEEMDANSDGKVTKEEFMEACRAHEKISNMLALKIVDIFITEDGDEEIEEEST